MRVLLLGGGGREHALAWKLAQSGRLTNLYAAPGNPGIAAHAELVALDIVDGAMVAAWAVANAIDLVVIGPEAPLVAGVADVLRGAGLAVFGPCAAAARLEGSKGFTKDLCAAAGVPTAAFVRARTRDEALAALDRFGVPVVVKADGLAAGKGVVVAATRAEAEAAVRALFPDVDVMPAQAGISGHARKTAEPGAPEAPAFAGATDVVEAVIEEFMAGEEASLFVLCDGEAALPLGAAGDHKRVGDGDTGPNTGGMGAFSPVPALTPALERRAMDEIVRPTLRAMASAGTPFSGLLYAGLMLTADGPKLVEYNVRFGDPEAQALMLRLEDDLLDLMWATATGALGQCPPVRLRPEAAVAVVIAAGGYPGTPVTGGRIEGVDEAERAGAVVFQAGTALRENALVASGGRVLAVAALGNGAAEAAARAYAGVDRIRFADGFHRRDIGARADVTPGLETAAAPG